VQLLRVYLERFWNQALMSFKEAAERERKDTR